MCYSRRCVYSHKPLFSEENKLSDSNITKVELENVLGSIEEKGTYETFGNIAIERSPIELDEPDAQGELSINDVEMPKKRGRKKKADTFPE